jgi:hypothetical protein
MITATLPPYFIDITDESDNEIEVSVISNDEAERVVAKGIIDLDLFLEFINWIDDEPVSWNWKQDCPVYQSYKRPVFLELKKEVWFESKIAEYLILNK